MIRDLQTCWLLVVLTATVSVVVIVDTFLKTPKRNDASEESFFASRRWAFGLTLVSLTASFVATWFVEPGGAAFMGAYEGNAFSIFFQRFALALGALSVVLQRKQMPGPEARSEYFVLFLTCLIGMCVAPAARDALVLWVGVELVTLPLCLMALYHEREELREPSDADVPWMVGALPKLFVVQLASTAVALFGLALVLGPAGTSRLTELDLQSPTALQSIGAMMVLVALGAKFGFVPVYLWMPSLYRRCRSAWIPFQYIAPQIVFIAVLAILLIALFPSTHKGRAVAAILGGSSILLGAASAIFERDSRRLIAHFNFMQLGFAVLGVSCGTTQSLGAALFFLVCHVCSAVGTLAVMALVTSDTSVEGDLVQFEGLAARSSWLALTLLLFLFSTAALPFSGGSWAKLSLLASMYKDGLAWGVMVGLLSVVPTVFVVLHLATSFFSGSSDSQTNVRAPATTKIVVGLCGLVVLLLGLFPGPLLDASLTAARSIAGETKSRIAGVESRPVTATSPGDGDATPLR